MSVTHPARRLTSALPLLAALAALAAALAMPSQTLAHTRKPACSTSSKHSKTKRGRTCAGSSHKGKGSVHNASKPHAKHPSTKKHRRTTPPASSTTPPASCEDGSEPVQGTDGSFSCGDGSQPECEDGATPTPSSNGARLLCPASPEHESESGEGECEEGAGSICNAGTNLDVSEHACQAATDGSSNFVCEDER